MRADSFMTSPSWPVSSRPPVPFIFVASTNSTSPPTPVTARPVATPGTAVRIAASWKKRWRPRPSRTTSRATGTGAATHAVGVHRARPPPGARGDLRRHLAQHGAQLALELAHARLAGVLAHD